MGNADIKYAREKNYKIKLIPLAKEVSNNEVVLYVLPKFISNNSMLYNVENENNGVLVKAAFADEQFFYGKGAGGHPTGSAVLSDIAALRYDYKYEYKKHLEAQEVSYTTNYDIKVYFRYEDEDVLENINFITISERFYSDAHKYVIGTINIQEIIDKRSLIHQDGNFLAEIL